jgi:hypothetical protein
MRLKINQKSNEDSLICETDPVGKRAVKTILFGIDITEYIESVEEKVIMDGTEITSYEMSTMSVPEYHKEITLVIKNNTPNRILEKIKQMQLLQAIGE